MIIIFNCYSCYLWDLKSFFFNSLYAPQKFLSNFSYSFTNYTFLHHYHQLGLFKVPLLTHDDLTLIPILFLNPNPNLPLDIIDHLLSRFLRKICFLVNLIDFYCLISMTMILLKMVLVLRVLLPLLFLLVFLPLIVGLILSLIVKTSYFFNLRFSYSFIRRPYY